MASWNTFTADAPELAAKVTDAFNHHKHKVLATIRADGSPRVSGTEMDFEQGDAWIGSMPDARKARDLQRDPRFAIHSAPIDLELKIPDVKIAGVAVEITDEAEKEAFVEDRSDPIPPGPFHLFRLDIIEATCTWVDGDKMYVEAWHEGKGVTHAVR